MSAVESMMLELETKAPDFTLPIVTGGILNLEKYSSRSKGTVIAFICNHCPYVKHINKALVGLANTYIQKGIGFIAINSNDIGKYPQDAPSEMMKVVKEENYPFPYLYDESQSVAKDYMAACTPDFFLFDREGKLVYRGQFDETRPETGKPATGVDLQKAIDAVLSGGELLATQIPSIGCNIKWIPGNEPDYFG
tara:strand:+ start:51694 stop:52275 length:582 start_codon:yes stop_codon:yes gene_type:complete